MSMSCSEVEVSYFIQLFCCQQTMECLLHPEAVKVLDDDPSTPLSPYCVHGRKGKNKCWVVLSFKGFGRAVKCFPCRSGGLGEKRGYVRCGWARSAQKWLCVRWVGLVQFPPHFPTFSHSTHANLIRNKIYKRVGGYFYVKFDFISIFFWRECPTFPHNWKWYFPFKGRTDLRYTLVRKVLFEGYNIFWKRCCLVDIP
jgi:hypothetical protein